MFLASLIRITGMIVALMMVTMNLNAEEEDQPPPPPPPITVQATGYGFYEAVEDEKPDPKRLLAMRASKLDAYRSLAERIYGLSLSGGSSVREYALQNDHFSARLDTVIRGARVISVIENKKTGIETVLELTLPGEFIECVNKANSLRADRDCIRPLPDSNRMHSSSVIGRSPMSKQYHLN